jgi:hypothetical protein
MRSLAVVFAVLTALYGVGVSRALAASSSDTEQEQSWDIPDDPLDEQMEAPDYDAPYPGSYDDDEMNSDDPAYPDEAPVDDDIRD